MSAPRAKKESSRCAESRKASERENFPFSLLSLKKTVLIPNLGQIWGPRISRIDAGFFCSITLPFHVVGLEAKMLMIFPIIEAATICYYGGHKNTGQQTRREILFIIYERKSLSPPFVKKGFYPKNCKGHHPLC